MKPILLLLTFMVASCASIEQWLAPDIESRIALVTPQRQQVGYRELYEFARLCEVIALPPEEIQAKLSGLGEISVFDDQKLNARAVLIIPEFNSVQFLVVRGTEITSIRNWINNLKVDLTPLFDHEARYHNGFLNHALVLHRQFVLRLDKTKRVVIVGHSLGGASGAIMGAILKKQGFKVDYVISFGQPKFTNEAGAAALGSLPLVRVVLDSDPVPQQFNQYTHTGTEVMLSKQNFPQVIFERYQTGLIFKNEEIVDHYLTTYLSLLYYTAQVSQSRFFYEEGGWQHRVPDLTPLALSYGSTL